MDKAEIDIELFELLVALDKVNGLNKAKKLKKLGIQTLDDLKKIKEIPHELRAEGFTQDEINNYKSILESREERESIEKATVGMMFLGPQGENADLLEKIIVDVLKDHIFWRRNFHPEDRFVIREEDKRTKEFEENKTRLFQNLYDLLRMLKRSNVPFSSPRYIGHMNSDHLLTGIVGYFAAMLYNPNNVAAEASPETTRLEIEFGKELAALMGYEYYKMDDDPKTFLEYESNKAWSHICSGGTIANLEALWVARTLKYLPLAIRKALEIDEELLNVINEINEIKKIYGKNFSDLTAWELLNLTPAQVLDLHKNVLQSAKGLRKQKQTVQNITSCSLSSLGMQRFIKEIQEIFKDDNKDENNIRPGVIIVPSTRHYSLDKVAEILGIGRGEEQLIRIPVNDNFRMNDTILKTTLKHLLDKKIPIIAVVSVCGSTEEGAIDPIDRIEEFRKYFGKKGLSFYHHCDASFGGYLRCLFRDKDNNIIIPEKLMGRMPDDPMHEWPTNEIGNALKAISKVDSVTIDPHKLGYIPYPAGAIVFKDGRIKWEIAFNPGYLTLSSFIGSYIVEGSKPGAAAAACWLSMKVFPLNESGHGTLIRRTIKNTYTLLAVLHRIEYDLHEDLLDIELNDKVKLKVLNDPPDMNIICFLINWIPDKGGDGTSLLRMNCFAEEVYNKHLNFSAKRALGEHKFIVSSTKFKYEEYGNSMQSHLEEISIKSENFKSKTEKYNDVEMNCCDDEIFAFRCTIMNPWLAVKKPDTKIYYMEQFRKDLKEAILAVVSDSMSLEKAVKTKITKNKEASALDGCASDP